MLRPIRRKLGEIRYYSAPRRGTHWTKGVVLSVFICIVVAPVMVWLCDQLVRTSVTHSFTGRVEIYADGTRRAQLIDPEELDYRPADVADYHSFTIIAPSIERGWPYASSIDRSPGQIDMVNPRTSRVIQNAKLAADDPDRAAINELLRSTDPGVVDALWGAVVVNEPQPQTWARAAFVWWLILWPLSLATVFLGGLAMMYYRADRELAKRARAASGLCPTCGYSMQGREFADRCPECGGFVY